MDLILFLYVIWYFESPLWPFASRAHMQRKSSGHSLCIIVNLFVFTYRQAFGDFSLTGFDHCVYSLSMQRFIVL